jgi:P4 family phage/plasmid primase-like protien
MMGIFSDWADHYWDAGLPVMPLQVKDKLPVIKGWQNLQRRMPTFEERESWKQHYPNGNIGLALGPESGLIAFDIDTDDPVVLGVLEKVLPPSPWERIGAKGKVWIYKFDGQRAFRIRKRNAEGKIEGLIDVQSTGTQIVVPPSIHPKTGQPYWQNCDLTEILDQVRSLPSNIEDVIKDALKQVGIECSSGEVGAITNFVSSGNRDNTMVSVAGLFARDVLRGNRTLEEVTRHMVAWVENFTAQVHGDSLDPQKGVSKVIEFLTRDVKGKGKALPRGWDEGLTDEQKKKLGLDFFTEDDERWSHTQIITEFDGQLEKVGIKDNEEQFLTLAKRTIQRIANNRELDNVDEDRLVRHIADVSGKRLTVASIRKMIAEIRSGEIKGTDHKEIAEAVLKDLGELSGEIRCYQSKLWQWNGSHWEEMNEQQVLQYITAEYGHLQAAKRANDHKGILTTMKQLCYGELCKNKVEGINFVNGFLTEDLQLREHHPDYGMTYTLPYPYLPDAAGKCQKWEQMLADYWGDDDDYADKVEALREAMCVTLFGRAVKSQLAFVLFGIAHSGKSRVLEIIRSLMPDNCSTAIPPQMWNDKFAPAQLAGKLLNMAGELSEHQMIDSASFKQIVEGAEISAQHKNQPMFTFRPVAAHWFATNHLPRSRDSSEGFTRRFLFFTFNKKFPTERRVEDYDKVVVAEEREAIAAWAVQAMLTLKANKGRITDPRSSQELRERLENQLNSVRSFLADLQEQNRLRLGSSQTEEATVFDTLWTEYRSYCVANGVSPVGSKSFVQRMEHLQGVFGYRVERAKTNLGFLTTQYRFLTLVRNNKAAA